jgi:hypothetical protein
LACRYAARFDLLDHLTFERAFESAIASFCHFEYPAPYPPQRKSGGRKGLWKMPQPWKSAKDADSHTLLGKASHKTLRLSHIYHSPGGGD